MCQDASSHPIAVGVVVAVQKVGEGTLSKIDGGALSHLMQKCLRSVAHEFMIEGIKISSSLYHLWDAACSQVASKRLGFFFLCVICTAGEMGFEVHEECAWVLVGSLVTIEYSYFGRKKWRQPEKRSKKNPKKLAKIP